MEASKVKCPGGVQGTGGTRVTRDQISEIRCGLHEQVWDGLEEEAWPSVLES